MYLTHSYLIGGDTGHWLFVCVCVWGGGNDWNEKPVALREKRNPLWLFASNPCDGTPASTGLSYNTTNTFLFFCGTLHSMESDKLNKSFRIMADTYLRYHIYILRTLEHSEYSSLSEIYFDISQLCNYLLEDCNSK